MEFPINTQPRSGTKKIELPKVDQSEQLALAMTLKKDESYLTAFTILKNLADKHNNPEAQYEVANMYFDGNNAVEKNTEKATAYYSQAASQGHAGAQNRYGRAFLLGLGIPQNDTLAISWFLESANQGHATAQYNLGRCHQKGRAIQLNMSTAISWYKKAAEQNYPMAQNALGLLYLKGEHISQSTHQAHTLFKRSADHGNAEGQFLLGWLHHYFYCTDNDLTTALEFYKKAADQGHVQAGEQYEKLRPKPFKEYWDSLVSGLGFTNHEKTEEESCELTELS